MATKKIQEAFTTIGTLATTIQAANSFFLDKFHHLYSNLFYKREKIARKIWAAGVGNIMAASSKCFC